MPDIREEFEAAIFAEVNEQRAAEGEFVLQHPEGLLARDDDGSYLIRWVKSAWWAWQASRAALRVELPKPHPAFEYAPRTKVFNITDVEIALRQAGIEVKHG
ncbi:TPA: hypothetical protein L4G80_005991 [Pseudomonas aeruginosa]|nr:hypothetical protein [Pseudomonas aeruginosa]HBO0183907.1 hypothetical protein [Pseudomonas aeruginosa]HBO2172113.1 hypothetical protein [Pseudomonas aeruginosa]HBP1486260.1 hypothetical protein [Pseudomonas aeruginosa]